MKLKILVDGNNCLYALFPRLPLEVARERLLNLLVKIASEKDYQVVVFFDQGFAERKKERVGQIYLLFPRKGEPADRLIEEEILNSSGKFPTYLITSDRSLRDLANLKKVICLKPEKLSSFLAGKSESSKNTRDKLSFKLANRLSKESLKKLEALKERKKV